MFMIESNNVQWWFWVVIAVVLSLALAGWQGGFTVVVAVATLNLLCQIYLKKSLTQFSVQVRLAFLLYVIAALPEANQWLYWVPGVATWARVLFGYCLMARMLMCLPWNRSEALSRDFIQRAFLSRPVRGSVLHGLA